MNKIFTLVLLTTFFTFRIFATNHIVTAQNFAFSPTSFNCTVGDSVTWQFVAGTTSEHQPASTTIPAGAQTWEQTIDAQVPTLTYVVMVAGVYNYQCNFHVSDGMIGQFTAAAATGIATVEETVPVKIYPVPFQNMLTVNASNNPEFNQSITIEVSNILGQQKYLVNSTDALTAPVDLDLSGLTPGIYFVTLSEGIVRKTYRVTKSE